MSLTDSEMVSTCLGSSAGMTALGAIAAIRYEDAELANTYLLAAASNICAVVQDSFSYVAVCVFACILRVHVCVLHKMLCATTRALVRFTIVYRKWAVLTTLVISLHNSAKSQCSKNPAGAQCVRALFDRMANSGQVAWCKTIALELVTAAEHVVKHAEATAVLLHVLCHPTLDDKGVLQALKVWWPENCVCDRPYLQHGGTHNHHLVCADV